MKPSPVLQFDPANHTYTIDGRSVPHVTGVLTSIFGEKPYWNEWYRDRGTAVHKAVEIIAGGQRINPSSLDERIAGRIAGFELFLREHPGLTIIASEFRVMHPRRYYAGTLDLLFTQGEKCILCDIKGTIDPVSTYPQMGAYTMAYQATMKKVKPIDEAWAMELTDGGHYRLKIGKRNHKGDFNIAEAELAWLSILGTYNWKHKWNGERQ